MYVSHTYTKWLTIVMLLELQNRKSTDVYLYYTMQTINILRVWYRHNMLTFIFPLGFI